MKMYEILVPTEMIRVLNGKEIVRPISTRYHRIWDEKVRLITKGLTIFPPSKGQWVSPKGEVFIERMIPVRIACTDTQIMEIAKMTIDYYNQQAVLIYVVSNEVLIINRENKCKNI